MSRSLVLCAVLVSLSLCLSFVSASHFAYGTISWEYAPTAALPNHYLLNFESAWRRSYPTWVPSNPSAGQTFTGYDIGDLVVSQTVNAGPCCGLPTSVDRAAHSRRALRSLRWLAKCFATHSLPFGVFLFVCPSSFLLSFSLCFLSPPPVGTHAGAPTVPSPAKVVASGPRR